MDPRLKHQVGRKGLQTQSGKIEFVSNSLKRFEDHDTRRRTAAHAHVPGVGRAPHGGFKNYPLGVVSPHPRFSFHTMGDAKDSFLNDIKDHRVLMDGHYYWIFRMNASDAEARGIKDGDLIRAYNDRGSVIFCCRITEAGTEGHRATATSVAPSTILWARPGNRTTAPVVSTS